MSQWIGATALILGLILLLARGARWWFDRKGPSEGPVEQLGRWRIAPDAHLRSLRVGEQVHLVLETRQGISSLAELSREQYDATFPSSGPAAALPSLAPLLRQMGLATR